MAAAAGAGQARRIGVRGTAVAVAVAAAWIGAAARADDDSGPGWHGFHPGNLILSRTLYDNRAANVAVGAVLPPNCAATTGGCSAPTGATNDGTYPGVWNNDLYDGSFGITSRIFLDELKSNGATVGTLEVPNSLQRGITAGSDQLVTSFSSKSELSLHFSLDGKRLTFMGYVAPVNAIDASNSNTPGAVDPTNPVGESFARAVAVLDNGGHFQFTETNAYSGNNGRSAILNNAGGANLIYTAGNAGNGANPQPAGVVLGAGAQAITPVAASEAAQAPGTPTPVSSFSITLLGAKADKVGKDDNFRGMTVHDNVLYFTKGSGSNGVNTVYFVDTTGTACPSGVGLPSIHAALPTQALGYDPSTLATTGLPSNMCILAGFPAVPNKLQTTVTAFPFGIWFADDKTVYVADEGDGYAGGADLYTHAAAQTTAGLQKWVFNAASQQWQLVYTLQTGLELGMAYSIDDYAQGTNGATGLPWAPATDGLRNIDGKVEDDGVAKIWAITSTVSGNGDPGADPNRLVGITDRLDNTDASVAANERFHTLRTARSGEALRGIAVTPGRDE